MSETVSPEQEAQLQAIGGSASRAWNSYLAAATVASGYSSASHKPDTKPRNPTTQDSITATIAALTTLAPADEIEGALAGQVVAFHGAALDALRRGAHPQGEDVATMWARAAELGRGMLDSLAALERRQAARKMPMASPDSTTTE